MIPNICMSGESHSAKHKRDSFSRAMPDLIKEVDVMHLGNPSALIKVPSFSRDPFGAPVPFNGREKHPARTVVAGLHRIITLSLECFNAWLSPLLSRSRKAAVSSVQDHDPYLESLLRALHGHK
jgi:hypothetical protein